MAETFVAIRRGPSGFSQRVCLKLVLPFFREDEEFVKLFQREARLAAKLRHSNIVGVIDFGEIAGRSYMAMELVDGVDLRVLLDAESARRLSPERVALLGHDLAAALNHAHNPPPDSSFDGEHAAIVHRDISPSNVLISVHGEIMLSDFGVAKAVTGSSRQQSAVKGKIPYMSPEQLRLEPLDGRADLFGVGVVLFEALCGQRPYEGGHDPATIMLILQGQHQPLASLAPGAPPELCALIESLIEPDREKRPGSAEELIELLDPFVPAPRVRRELGKRVAELRPEEKGPQELGSRPTARESIVGQTEEEQISGIVGAGEGQEQVDRWTAESGLSAPETATPAKSESFVTGALPKRRRHRSLLASLFAVALLGGGMMAWRALDDARQVTETPPTPTEVEPKPVAAVDESRAEIDADEQNVDEITAEREASKTATEIETSPTGDHQLLADETQKATDQPTQRPRSQPVVQTPASLTVVVYPWGDVWINGRRRGPAPLKNLALKPGRYRIDAGQGQPTVTRTIRLRPGQEKKLRLDVTK